MNKTAPETGARNMSGRYLRVFAGPALFLACIRGWSCARGAIFQLVDRRHVPYARVVRRVVRVLLQVDSDLSGLHR